MATLRVETSTACNTADQAGEERSIPAGAGEPRELMRGGEGGADLRRGPLVGAGSLLGVLFALPGEALALREAFLLPIGGVQRLGRRHELAADLGGEVFLGSEPSGRDVRPEAFDAGEVLAGRDLAAEGVEAGFGGGRAGRGGRGGRIGVAPAPARASAWTAAEGSVVLGAECGGP